MRVGFGDLDLSFSLGGAVFQVLNLVYEQLRRTIPSHSHGGGSFEIHYIASGYGAAQVGGRRYEISPGTLYVTGPHTEHAQTPDSRDPMCEYCVYFKLEEGRRHGGRAPGEEAVLRAFARTSFWFGRDTQRVGVLLEEVFEELEQRRTGYVIQAEALLKSLVVKLVRSCEEYAGTDAPAGRSSLTEKSAVIIEDYFLYEYQSLSLEELADRLGLGARQTERLLKKLYGKTFLQKKTEARMSAAVLLLSDEGRSVTAIAELLGYSSVEHFSSAFKSFYGCSPRAYRKQGAPPGAV